VKTRIERYTDVAAYARNAPIHLAPNETSHAWSLGVSTKRAVTLACDGDPSLVAAYDAALLDLDTSQGRGCAHAHDRVDRRIFSQRTRVPLRKSRVYATAQARERQCASRNDIREPWGKLRR
jgi:hypothetical protein